MELQEMQNIGEQQQSRIATEEPSYHAIRIYNMIRDRLWEKLEAMNKGLTTEEVLLALNDLRLLLLRGDKTWMEIKKAIDEKKAALKVRTEPFKYDGELKKKADALSYIILLTTNPRELAINDDAEALAYMALRPFARLQYTKQKAEAIILEADEDWGNKAALIGHTMPIEVRESKDPFF